MKLVDVVQIVRDSIAQTMGDDFDMLIDPDTHQPISNEAFATLPAQKLVDIGTAVTSETTINSLATGMLARLGRHVIEARDLPDFMPSIDVDPMEWGGFLERTRVGLGDILDDPMYGKVAGTSYADIEHTFYGQDVHSKLFQEGKAIMCPVSIERDELRDAFLSWDKMNDFLSAKRAKIRATISLGSMAMKRMLISCAIAKSDLMGSAVHLITEAVAEGIVNKVEVTPATTPATYRNPTYAEVRNDPSFIAFCLEKMASIRGYMRDPSTAFNDGSLVTWSIDDPRLILLRDFTTKARFLVKANTFNLEQIGIGDYDTVNSWQAIKDIDTSTDPDTVHTYDPVTLSSVYISADASGKIGSTSAYNKSGIIGFMFDPMAVGISLMRTKVTSSYTACADFWNEFNHQLTNYIMDSSYGMVAFIAD